MTYDFSAIQARLKSHVIFSAISVVLRLKTGFRDNADIRIRNLYLSQNDSLIFKIHRLKPDHKKEKRQEEREKVKTYKELMRNYHQR